MIQRYKYDGLFDTIRAIMGGSTTFKGLSDFKAYICHHYQRALTKWLKNEKLLDFLKPFSKDMSKYA